MKYVSLDLETTCIEDKRPENILMISMVVEDPKNPLPLEQLPHFTRFIKNNPISGELYALSMNGWILDIVSGRNKTPPKYEISTGGFWELAANNFLDEHFGHLNNKIFVAGKNVASFDLKFLPKELQRRFSHRVIDPAMKFTDLLNDEKVADLTTCKVKAGLTPTVAHDAREDALDVIATLRNTYGKNL